MPETVEAPVAWTQVALTISTSVGDMDTIGFTTPSVPGLAVVQRTYEDGVVEWSVTHTASGRGIQSYRDVLRAEIPEREKAERYLLALRDVTDWTRPMEAILDDRVDCTARMRPAREAVFGSEFRDGEDGDAWKDFDATP